MSAYLVSREHIAYLIDSALLVAQRERTGAFRWYHGGAWHELRPENAAEVAQALWDENSRSLGARYGEKREQRTVYGTHRRRWRDNLDPFQLFKSCRCYSYQSCESEDWEQTWAHAFIESLQSGAISCTPEYAAAEWGPPKDPPKVNGLRVVREELFP